MKKILMVVGSMNIGGIENYIMTILRNIDRKKVNIELLYITNEVCFYDKEIYELGYKIIKITGRNENPMKHIHELKVVLKKGKYDIMHINYGTATCMLDAWIAKKYGIKTIVHSHNSNGCNNIVNSIFKLLFNKYVDIMLSCSREAKKWMFLDKYSDDVIIMKNAIEIDKYIFDPVKRKAIRDKLLLEEDTICIGEVARFSEQKNHQYIFEFIKYIDKKYKFILIGDGDLKEIFMKKAKELGIEDKFIFTGNIKNPQDYLNALDVFIMPSLYEGFPVSLVEAQCNGLHCVISDTIDKKIDLIGNVDFIGIQKADAENWGKALNNNKIYKRDKLAKKKIIACGYDISQTLEELYKIYGVK